MTDLPADFPKTRGELAQLIAEEIEKSREATLIRQTQETVKDHEARLVGGGL